MFVGMVFLWNLSGFGTTFERCFNNFLLFLRKRKYVKTSTACARELDFQGSEGFGFVYVYYFVGVGFGMAPGMGFE